MTPLLEVHNISFAYPRHPVLEELNLHINPGELVCLLGPNGCGKTTFLDCIMGWLKPQKGEILLQGVSLDKASSKYIARNLAYVPQSHEKTFPYTVNEMVLMGRASYLGMFQSPTNNDFNIAEEALEKVGISHLKDRPYTKLSGGEGQLVMVARALAQETPFIIMDEPTAHLDFNNEMKILEIIVHLIKTTNLSVLMATHIPNHCFYFENNSIPTRVALLKKQKILAEGRASEVLREENLEELYQVRTRVVDYEFENGQSLKQVIPISTLNPWQIAGGERSYENVQKAK